MNQKTSKVHQFGNFRLDVGRRLLFKNQEQVSLPPKAFEILQFLVESDGKIVEKSDLSERTDLFLR